MKTAVVVGSGAGGAAVARELQGRFQVTVLEAGGEFRPFPVSLAAAERIKRTGLLVDERLIRPLYPAMQIRKTREGLVLVNGVGTGGTTTVSTGNALRLDAGVRAIGVDLDREYAEVAHEVPITAAHERLWREPTRELFRACAELDLRPRAMPKMGRYDRCANCGRCVLGCRYGVKWDARAHLADALQRGATLLTRHRVERVVIEGDTATGVVARHCGLRRFFPANLVVLAAGGLATPVILERSRLACEPTLFVDPVLCVAARLPGARQSREMPMPFYVEGDGYIISPYFDYLSFFFTRSWRHPAQDIVSLMIKLADDAVGRVAGTRVDKLLTSADRRRLDEAASLCRRLLARIGIRPGDTFLGTLNAGHPGGMLPLTEREAGTLHHDRLPPNLYVADATLLPRSLGGPPILTVLALAKRVARAAAEQVGE
ncbi:MAG: GMC family oxidoreductase [Anaerolineae bacterium]|nr:GMC family oxidoreductase [Anaerolineae bacterium]